MLEKMLTTEDVAYYVQEEEGAEAGEDGVTAEGPF